MLRFSANLGFLWRKLRLAEAIRRAKAAGFDAVEFHHSYDTPAASVRAALAGTGLPAVGLNTRPGDVAAGDMGLAALPGRETEARAAIDDALEYARAIGAGYVHVTAGRPDERIAGDARRAFLEALDYAATRAAPAGTAILIEPLNARDAPGYFLNNLDQAAHLVAGPAAGERENPVRLLSRPDHRGRSDPADRDAAAADRAHSDRRGAVARRAGRRRGGLRPVAEGCRRHGISRLRRGGIPAAWRGGGGARVALAMRDALR